MVKIIKMDKSEFVQMLKELAEGEDDDVCKCGCSQMYREKDTIPSSFREEVQERYPGILPRGPITIDGFTFGIDETTGMYELAVIATAPKDIGELERYVASADIVLNLIQETAFKIHSKTGRDLEDDPFFVSSMAGLYAQYASAQTERMNALDGFLQWRKAQ